MVVLELKCRQPNCRARELNCHMSPSTQKRLKKYFEEVTVTTSCNMNTLILDFLLETETVCVHKGGSHTFKDVLMPLSHQRVLLFQS